MLTFKTKIPWASKSQTLSVISDLKSVLKILNNKKNPDFQTKRKGWIPEKEKRDDT